MKKVAVFTSALLRYSETFIRDQARSLVRWHPILIGNRRIRYGLPLDDLEVEVLNSNRLPGWSRLRLSLCYWFAVADPVSVGRLRQKQFALIHAHFGTNAVDIWPVAEKLRLPMLVTLHGYDINLRPQWWEAGRGGIRRRNYPHRLLAMAQHPRVRFLAVSHAIRQSAIAVGIPEKKILVHHVGVDIERFRPGGMAIAERPKRILFVGRLIENKGVEFLMHAFARLRVNVPYAELVVAGDGKLREHLRGLARYLSIPVRFLGTISAQDVKRQLDEARVLCLPSVTLPSGASEAFGIVLLEAQACGVPVVTSSPGGKKEGLEDGETGFAFAERDIDSLTRHLTVLLTDDKLLRRMSSRAVEFVRRSYDIRACTARLEELYDAFAASPVSP